MSHPWNLIKSLSPQPEMINRRHNRGQIAAWTRELFDNWYPDVEKDPNLGTCVYWVHAGCAILQLCGYRAILQAGTMQWTFAPDRGTNNTHFGYEYDPTHPVSVLAMHAGIMPEIHCWIALPDENEIVDFSTGGFRRIAEARGMKWELSDPPPYLWTTAHTLPPGVIYQPSLHAIRYMFGRMKADEERFLSRSQRKLGPGPK